MKIALLGPKRSGKTVYFTGLYKEFRDNVALLPLTEEKKARYIRMNADKRVRFQLSVSSYGLERELSENADKLSARPITPDDWPEPTENLNRSQVPVVFEFTSINKSRDGSYPSEKFNRSVEIFDPSGDVFKGRTDESGAIIDELSTCDVCVVMLPSDEIISIYQDYDSKEDRDEDIRRLISEAFHLGKIEEVLARVREKSPPGDIIPVCMAVTKADQIKLHENVTQFIKTHLYDNIIIPFSQKMGNENLIMCVCPISVLNPKRNIFSASNLEWPFLFAAGGTILRNSQDSRHESEYETSKAREAESEVSKIKGYGFWRRTFNFFRRRRHEHKARVAYSEAGRLIKSSNDDMDLARNVWSALATEGKENGVRIFKGGEELEDPRMVTL